MELQETSMTRICEPQIRCYRSAVKTLSLGLQWRWFSRRGNSPGVVPCCHRFKPWAHGFGRPHGGRWWWWPLEIASTGVGLRDGMRRLNLNVAIFGIIRHFWVVEIIWSCVNYMETFHEFYMIFICYGFPRAKKRAEKIGLTITKTQPTPGEGELDHGAFQADSHEFQG